MKFLTVAALTLFSLSSFANHHKDHKKMEEKFDKMSFEDAKKWKTEKLDKKAAWVEEGRACVNAAKDKEALKGCMKEMHEEKKEMKEKMKKKMKK